jgi:sulfite exporter TauE/SafE
MIGLGLSAALIGFWSSGHCLAMCGGLAIAAGESQRRLLNLRSSQRVAELLAWQLGRIGSYGFMGLMAGAFGALILHWAPIEILRHFAFAAANLLLIGLGLHVARLHSGVLILERAGQLIWKQIAPFAAATLIPSPKLPYQSRRQIITALRAGAIWGWLPCGLVYSMLVTASVSGGALQGAAWMLGFGIGTIPALWLTSMLSQSTLSRLQSTALRGTMGLLIVGFGLWGLLRLLGLIRVDWLDAFCIGGGISVRVPL